MLVLAVLLTTFFALIFVYTCSRTAAESQVLRLGREAMIPAPQGERRAILARYVQRANLAGYGGAFVGAAGVLALVAWWPPASEPGTAIALFIAVLALQPLGTLVVGFRRAIFPRTAPPHARLRQPGLDDHVSSVRRWLPCGLAALAALLLIIAVLGPIPISAALLTPPLIILGVALVGVATTPTLARLLLERPQLAQSDADLAWDDALRGDTLLQLHYWLTFLAGGAVAFAVPAVMVAAGAIEAPASPGPLAVVPLFLAIVVYRAPAARRRGRAHLWQPVSEKAFA